jgi:hypothetical protein
MNRKKYKERGGTKKEVGRRDGCLLVFVFEKSNFLSLVGNDFFFVLQLSATERRKSQERQNEEVKGRRERVRGRKRAEHKTDTHRQQTEKQRNRPSFVVEFLLGERVLRVDREALSQLLVFDQQIPLHFDQIVVQLTKSERKGRKEGEERRRKRRKREGNGKKREEEERKGEGRREKERGERNDENEKKRSESEEGPT